LLRHPFNERSPIVCCVVYVHTDRETGDCWRDPSVMLLKIPAEPVN
jgi:hypothetical protein